MGGSQNIFRIITASVPVASKHQESAVIPSFLLFVVCFGLCFSLEQGSDVLGNDGVVLT